MPDGFICEARRYGDRLWCGRCDVSFAATAADAPCKPPPACGLTLSFLRAAAEAEGIRIDGSVDAAVALAGHLAKEGHYSPEFEAPNRELLRRAAALRAIVRLIDRVMADGVIMERLRKGGGNG